MIESSAVPGAPAFLEALGPAGRRDLLRVLTSTDEVRADVIRQFYERPGGKNMAELLMILEERERTWQTMIEELQLDES